MSFVSADTTPRITSIAPSHLSITTRYSALQYGVPLGFTDEVFSCIAFGVPLPSIAWCKTCGSGIIESKAFSSNTRTIGSYIVVLLQFKSGFRESDAGTYHCIDAEAGLHQSVTLSVVADDEYFSHSSSSRCISTASESAETFFELRVLGTNCSTWNGAIMEEIANDMQLVVAGGILSVCKTCPTSDSALIVYSPTCSHLVDGAARFRGKISTSQQHLTKFTYCILKFWLQLGPAVTIAGNLNPIDRGCVFELTSLFEVRECMGLTLPPISLAGTVVPIAGVGVIFLFFSAMIFYFLVRRYAKKD